MAPLAIAAVLGFAFAGNASTSTMTIGVSGATVPLVRAAVHASQLPDHVVVRVVPSAAALRREVADGMLAGGVVVSPDPHAAVGPSHSHGGTGRDAVARLRRGRPGQRADRAGGGRIGGGGAGEPALRRPPRARDGDRRRPISVATGTLGNGGKAVLDYFAPSIAVIFLFIGSGLGMRSLMMERVSGTLTRLAAAPVRPSSIVWGKLLAIALTGLSSILIVWGTTAAVFGADWGDPLGVLMLCVGATAAVCGLGAFVTSFARTPQEAFAASLVIGLVLALFGGNLLPPGALPEPLQVLSLGTPNGWALVGFGRLALLRDPAASVVGPFVVLCLIALVTGGLALARVRRMVTP